MPRKHRPDFFIAHASEDKSVVARPLAEALLRDGYIVWYDEYSLELGDSLRRSLDHGLATCRAGVVILSPNFIAKPWTNYELDGLVSRLVYARSPVLFPVWHGVDHAGVLRFSPSLADRVATTTDIGVDAVAKKLTQALLYHGLRRALPKRPVPPRSPDERPFGYEVELFMRRSGASSQGLARLLGTTPRQLRLLLAGDLLPTEELLPRLRVALRLSMVEYGVLLAQADWAIRFEGLDRPAWSHRERLKIAEYYPGAGEEWVKRYIEDVRKPVDRTGRFKKMGPDHYVTWGWAENEPRR